jgi:hypothetical protein
VGVNEQNLPLTHDINRNGTGQWQKHKTVFDQQAVVIGLDTVSM